jgi:hypothetical protein
MPKPALQSPFDADAYLAWEDRQAEQHEYLRGEVFALVGARREHVVVSMNLAAAFKLVSCDSRDHVASQFMAHPTLIVEGLSESTAAFDRGDKFAAHRTLPSLQEYVLVDIPSRRVETFRRTADQDWLFHEHRPDLGDCHFPALGVSIPFDEIFENVVPEQAGFRGEA